jgi:hypothetical protein
MPDYLDSVFARHRDEKPEVRPRTRSIFEPLPLGEAPPPPLEVGSARDEDPGHAATTMPAALRDEGSRRRTAAADQPGLPPAPVAVGRSSQTAPPPRPAMPVPDATTRAASTSAKRALPDGQRTSAEAEGTRESSREVRTRPTPPPVPASAPPPPAPEHHPVRVGAAGATPAGRATAPMAEARSAEPTDAETTTASTGALERRLAAVERRISARPDGERAPTGPAVTPRGAPGTNARFDAGALRVALRPTDTPRQAAPSIPSASRGEMFVHVSIGRIDVRAAREAEKAERLPAAEARPTSLDEYLRRRNGGGR